MNINRAAVETRLQEILVGKKCVSAWLGYGEPLFLGFGDQILPERLNNGVRTTPAFELQTNFADWFVDKGLSPIPLDLDRANLTAAAKSLVGEEVKRVEVTESWLLRITFSEEKMLRVKPWGERDGRSDAWSIQLSNGQIIAVSNFDAAVVIDATVPVKDWFPEFT